VRKMQGAAGRCRQADARGRGGSVAIQAQKKGPVVRRCACGLHGPKTAPRVRGRPPPTKAPATAAVRGERVDGRAGGRGGGKNGAG
jgi:hypothetical protein